MLCFGKNNTRVRGQECVEKGIGRILATPPIEWVWLVNVDISVEIGKNPGCEGNMRGRLIEVCHGNCRSLLDEGPQELSGGKIGGIGVVMVKMNGIARPEYLRAGHIDQRGPSSDFVWR